MCTQKTGTWEGPSSWNHCHHWQNYHILECTQLCHQFCEIAAVSRAFSGDMRETESGLLKHSVFMSGDLNFANDVVLNIQLGFGGAGYQTGTHRGCQHSQINVQHSTNSSLQGSVSWVNPKCKAKDELLHGGCRKKLVCASCFLTMCSSCCRHSTSRIPTYVRWSLALNLILCHLPLTGFPNRCLCPVHVYFRCFLRLIGVPKISTRCQVQYIRHFLPREGEVLRVDTIEA